MTRRLSVRLGLVLVLVGCGAGRSASDASPGDASFPPFVRVVDAFPVQDESGAAYDHPLLGGLNVPRPQFVDIDGDDDLDLFVQEFTGAVMFLENTGSPDAARFAWRTDRYDGLDVGEWYRFVDMDTDGDFDLLTEQPFNYLRYYRNDGTATAARFTLAADTLRDPAGDPIFSDRQNIPQVADLDCDARPDLFLGRVTGTITRYETTEPVLPEGVPRFRFVEDDFENIEIVAQQGSRHGANTMALIDIDDDGDLDLFWGDFFEPGILFLENRGTCEAPSINPDPVSFPINEPVSTSGFNAPVFGDLDADGDLDLLVGVLGGAFNPNRTAARNMLFLDRTGAESFALRTERFVTAIDVGSESIARPVDWDGDGDLDLLLANKIDPDRPATGSITLFENTGTATAPAYRRVGRLPFEGAYHLAPAFGDLDGDGDQDMLLGNWRDRVAYYRNDGSDRRVDLVLADSAIVTLTRGRNTTPALVDIDGDGDLDLFVGEGSGTINYYENTGTPGSPAFTLVSDEFADIDVGQRSHPAFVDIDRDGDQDMLVGRESRGFAFYRNVGDASVQSFVLDPSFALPLPPYAAPAFVDLDGDGDLDLLSGGLGGGVNYYENRTR